MKRTILLIPMAAAILVFSGCQNSTPPVAEAEKTYPIKGKVTAVNVAAKEITIDHEDIPGLMKAMQMTFAVEDAKLLEGIKPGASVEGKLKDVSGRHVVTALKEIGADTAEQKKIKVAFDQLPADDRLLAEKQRLCPASDEPLGAMGVPIKLSIKGQTVFICCKSCKEDVEKKPDEMLKKVAEFKANVIPR
jgi:Cu/Ag efflux protein CusF